MDEKLAKELTEGTMKMYEALRPSMATHDNPKFTEFVRGTNLEKLPSQDLERIPKIMNRLYFNRYKAFREAWTNVFGGNDVRMLKKNPAIYLDEFMTDVIRYKKTAFKKGFPEKWLKMRFMKELHEERSKLV